MGDCSDDSDDCWELGGFLRPEGQSFLAYPSPLSLLFKFVDVSMGFLWAFCR